MNWKGDDACKMYGTGCQDGRNTDSGEKDKLIRAYECISA